MAGRAEFCQQWLGFMTEHVQWTEVFCCKAPGYILACASTLLSSPDYKEAFAVSHGPVPCPAAHPHGLGSSTGFGAASHDAQLSAVGVSLLSTQNFHKLS